MKVKTNTPKSSPSVLLIKLRSSVPAQLILAGTILLLIAGFGWYRYVYLSTSNVFNGMLDQSLRTTSYTRTATTSQQGVEQKVQTQVQFGADTFARRLTTLSQQVGDQRNSVQREAIGTTTTDYERLVSADFPSEPEASAGYDAVKGKWVKAGGEKDAESNQVLLGALFGILPMGSVTPEQQAELLDFVRSEQVYTVDEEPGIIRSEVDGQEVYVYTVKIKQAPYIAYVQKFSEAIGLGKLTQFDANQYIDEPDITVRFAVRPASRQLVSIEYPANSTQTERYSSYGVRSELEEPKDSVTLDQLQGTQQ